MTTKYHTIIKDKQACYAIFSAHDTRFDGRVFVGVSSTGIYCRPICRVKMPKFENCTYYSTPAAAESAGFRPCLKCRPELAPELCPLDVSTQLARQAALIIGEDCLADSTLSRLATALNVSDRHMRRVFIKEFGIPPVQYLQTRRLLLAKSLLTDTQLQVTDVALSAGFGSVRRFNDLFKKHYKLTPTSLRKNNSAAMAQHKPDTITLHLGYRPPYRWDQILSFLEARAIPGVEAVVNHSYCRTVFLPYGNTEARGWVAIENNESKNSLQATISSSLLPVIARLLPRIRILFDLDCLPLEIHTRLLVMNEISPGLCVPGTRLPGAFDAFEMAVRAILGQQVTVKAAKTFATRMAAAFGDKITTPHTELTHTFPSAATIARLPGQIEDHLGRLGIIRARARSILALATALSEGAINLSPHADPEQTIKRLQTLPGIGPWTAQYIAMRGLSWPDAFPHTDYGVKKALTGMHEKEILKLAEKWRPWRSYATINLWNSL